MYDPKKVFTPGGYDDYRLHLAMMGKAAHFLINNADDLHIGGTGEDDEALLYKIEGLISRLKDGPFDEDYDEDGHGAARSALV